jgi:hypothetical protein
MKKERAIILIFILKLNSDSLTISSRPLDFTNDSQKLNGWQTLTEFFVGPFVIISGTRCQNQFSKFILWFTQNEWVGKQVWRPLFQKATEFAGSRLESVEDFAFLSLYTAAWILGLCIADHFLYYPDWIQGREDKEQNVLRVKLFPSRRKFLWICTLGSWLIVSLARDST